MRESSGSPCVTCGQCCRSYVVSLLGYDVWRISRALRLSPELFVLAHDQPEPADDGFLLEPDGWPQGLALDKRGEFGPGQPCVFLVELGGGHACCGVYQDRPVVCRTYPMGLREAPTRVREDALCPPGVWSDQALARTSWQAALDEYRREWAFYVEMVGEWNAKVRATGASFTFPEYLASLINRYDDAAAEGISAGLRETVPTRVRQS